MFLTAVESFKMMSKTFSVAMILYNRCLIDNYLTTIKDIFSVVKEKFIDLNISI